MTDDEYEAYFRRSFEKWETRARVAGLDWDDAFTVAQRLFVELYAQCAGIETPEEADRFIRGRLRNRVIDVWRHNGRRHEHEFLVTCDDFRHVPGPPNPGTDPEEWVEFFVSEKVARDLLNELSEKECLLLRLRALGYDSSECAQALGISRGTERARWSRLKNRLAKDVNLLVSREEAAE
ncbi:sigma-70 family RNA polymerase sigma factor [Streptomyces hundungensis]|uniref:RNA polymerase sigma factor n=1 Tax=Streptomyces hundungensis TaxID=1077946 RepID=UPI0033CF8CE4